MTTKTKQMIFIQPDDLKKEINPYFKILEQKTGAWYVTNYKHHEQVTKFAPFEELKAYLWQDENYKDVHAVMLHFHKLYGKRKLKERTSQNVLAEDQEYMIKELQQQVADLEQQNKQLLEELADKESRYISLSENITELRKDAAKYRRIRKILYNKNGGPNFLNRNNKHLDKKSFTGYFYHDKTYFSRRDKQTNKGKAYSLTPEDMKFLKRVDEFLDGIHGNSKAHWRMKQ